MSTPDPGKGAVSYAWRGVKRDGTGASGGMTMTPADLAAIVHDRFARGWRSLSVTRDGAEVARIGPDPSMPSQRTWWSETALSTEGDSDG